MSAAADELLTAAEVSVLRGISAHEAETLIRRTPGHVRIGRTYRLPAWCLSPTAEQARVLDQQRADQRAALSSVLRVRALSSRHAPARCTYVVHAPAAWLVKIGRSKCLERRLASLEAGSPVPLHLVALFAGTDIEDALHEAFYEHRAHGEWFSSEPVLEYLRALGVTFDG